MVKARRASRSLPPTAAFWRTVNPAAAPTAGLSDAEAASRLASEGPNTLEETTSHSLPRRILRRVSEPLMLILVASAIVSALAGDTASLIIILVIVALSVGLDVYQEHGAEAAAAALRRSIAPNVRVIREGREQVIPSAELVRGDLVRLAPGNLVPADGVIVASRSLRVDEAILTGEPFPVEKRRGPSNAPEMADAFDALFAGTAVVSGEATVLVVATGRATAFGAISEEIVADQPPSAFERGLHRLGLLIVRLTLALVLFVLLVQLVLHRPALESFMFAVALAVGLTPELLPMVMTVTLSRGALRMARRKVLVKRLGAIHDLGAMDVLCTDKTGTLTDARIRLSETIGPGGAADDRVLELAAINSALGGSTGNPLDEAILAGRSDIAKAWTHLADLPFDFERRRATVLVAREGERLLIAKGAPETVLPLCTMVATGPTATTLDDSRRSTIEKLLDDRARQGERILAVAWRLMPAAFTDLTTDAEAQLTFAGLCAFSDPPKPSAAAAIARLRTLGVRVKVISGDAAPVVSHLIATLGLGDGAVVLGNELDRLSERALRARVVQTDYYARVTPDQKLRIIRALSQAGHTVGFMGDGINDAPAIRAADAGLSVDTATDVARGAADLILLDNDLGVIADGVEEGRRTYANIMKYVRMGTSSNFGNMLSMALASVAVPFLPMTAVQILLNNLIYDASQTSIPFDDVDAGDLAEPHNWSITAIERFTAWMGPLSSAFDLTMFGVLLLIFRAAPAEFRTAWFVESMLTQLLVIFVIRTRAAPWRSRPSRALVATVIVALMVAMGCALGPWHALFGFAPLPWHLHLIVVALAATYLAAAQLLKRKALAAL